MPNQGTTKIHAPVADEQTSENSAKAVESSGIETTDMDQSTNHYLSTKSLSVKANITSVVSTQNKGQGSTAVSEATTEFFDKSSNMVAFFSTIGAVSALCLASIVVCVLATKFTVGRGLVKR